MTIYICRANCCKMAAAIGHPIATWVELRHETQPDKRKVGCWCCEATVVTNIGHHEHTVGIARAQPFKPGNCLSAHEAVQGYIWFFESKINDCTARCAACWPDEIRKSTKPRSLLSDVTANWGFSFRLGSFLPILVVILSSKPITSCIANMPMQFVSKIKCTLCTSIHNLSAMFSNTKILKLAELAELLRSVLYKAYCIYCSYSTQYSDKKQSNDINCFAVMAHRVNCAGRHAK